MSDIRFSFQSWIKLSELLCSWKHNRHFKGQSFQTFILQAKVKKQRGNIHKTNHRKFILHVGTEKHTNIL